MPKSDNWSDGQKAEVKRLASELTWKFTLEQVHPVVAALAMGECLGVLLRSAPPETPPSIIADLRRALHAIIDNDVPAMTELSANLTKRQKERGAKEGN
jgi:hypothetical protein